MDQTSMESFLKLKNKIMDTSSLINLYESSKNECNDKEWKISNLSKEYSKLMEKHKKLLVDYLDIEKREKTASVKLKQVSTENMGLVEKNSAHEAYQKQLQELITSLEKSASRHSKEMSDTIKSHQKELQDASKKSSQSIEKLTKNNNHLINLVQLFGEKAKNARLLTSPEKRLFRTFLKSNGITTKTKIKKCPNNKNEETLLNLNEPLSCVSVDTGRGSSICTSDDEKYISNATTPERQLSPIRSYHEEVPCLNKEVFKNKKGFGPKQSNPVKKNTRIKHIESALVNEDDISDSKIEEILNSVRNILPKPLSPIPSSPPAEPISNTSLDLLNTNKCFQNVPLLTEYFSNIARQIMKEELMKITKSKNLPCDFTSNVNIDQKKESLIPQQSHSSQSSQQQLSIQKDCINFTDILNLPSISKQFYNEISESRCVSPINDIKDDNELLPPNKSSNNVVSSDETKQQLVIPREFNNEISGNSFISPIKDVQLENVFIDNSTSIKNSISVEKTEGKSVKSIQFHNEISENTCISSIRDVEFENVFIDNSTSIKNSISVEKTEVKSIEFYNEISENTCISPIRDVEFENVFIDGSTSIKNRISMEKIEVKSIQFHNDISEKCLSPIKGIENSITLSTPFDAISPNEILENNCFSPEKHIQNDEMLLLLNNSLSPESVTSTEKAQEISVIIDIPALENSNHMDVYQDEESELIIDEAVEIQNEESNWNMPENVQTKLTSEPELESQNSISNISCIDTDHQEITSLPLDSSITVKNSERFKELFDDDDNTREFTKPTNKISKKKYNVKSKLSIPTIRKSPRFSHESFETDSDENMHNPGNIDISSQSLFTENATERSPLKTSNRKTPMKQKSKLEQIRKSTRKIVLSRKLVDCILEENKKDLPVAIVKGKRKSDNELQDLPPKVPKNSNMPISKDTNEEKLNRAKLILSTIKQKAVPEKTTFIRKKVIVKRKPDMSEPKMITEEEKASDNNTLTTVIDKDISTLEYNKEILTYDDILGDDSNIDLCFIGRLFNKYQSQVKIKCSKRENKLDPDIVEALEENLVDFFTSETLDDLYKILSKKKEKKIATAMVNYLEKQRTLNLGDVFLESTPGISGYHYRLLACLNRLYKSPPPSFKHDLYSLIMDGIQYRCFTLQKTPSLQSLENMAVFYTILCRITKQKEKLKLFCMDTIYCLSFKAIPVILRILKLWPQILPKRESYAAEDPIVKVIVHSLLTHFPQRAEYKASNIKGLLFHNYGYNVGEYTDDLLIDILMEKLKGTKGGIESTCIESAFTILGKRLDVRETYKKLINAQLLPLIDEKTTSTESKCASIHLIGILSRPFPPSMSMQRQGLMKKIFTMINNDELPAVQEAAIRSLCYFKKDNFKNWMDLLKTWKPNFSVSIETENTIKQILFQRNKGFWNKLLV